MFVELYKIKVITPYLSRFSTRCY